MSTHWTEPKQKNVKTWTVTKIMNGLTTSVKDFKSKQDAWSYLKKINFYWNKKVLN